MCLGQATLKLLERLAEIPQKKDELERINTFGPVRMIETAIINMNRVHVLWDLVTVHLDCLANSKFSPFRVLAIECFSCFVVSMSATKKAGIDGQFWEDDQWQQKVLSAVLSYLKSPYIETTRTMMNNLPYIINVNVEFINRIVEVCYQDLAGKLFSISLLRLLI